jgi:hypothetical protein
MRPPLLLAPSIAVAAVAVVFAIDKNSSMQEIIAVKILM